MIINANAEPIVELAIRLRIPSITQAKTLMERGLLMSYGADFRDLQRRIPSYVDRILKGAKPADMPVERPTKFELAINMKTAKAIGLTIPQSLLMRADDGDRITPGNVCLHERAMAGVGRTATVARQN